MSTECQTLATRVGEMFSCTEHPGGFVRVRTPFLYPDGDIIDVFAKSTGDVTTVTDLGETLRWLRTQNVSGRRSQKQRQILADVCLNHNVELYRGMLTARAQGPREFAPAVLKVAQAALRAADLWFTFRTRAFESIVDEVSEFFDERKFKYVRGEKIAGRSGRAWTVDFHARLASQSAMINVLSTGSRATARGVVDHTVALWFDISHLKAAHPLKFVSLIDDTVDVWSPEDIRLVSDLSDVARWSNTDEFERILRAA